jgi:competence ComEA-like helix-hairpin-helix protein
VAAGVTPAADSPLDLNHASPAELVRLPGIGPKLAERIVRHREATGGYRSADDLAGVPGLGARRAAALRPLVSVVVAPGEGRDRSDEPSGAALPPGASASGAAGPSPHPAEDERWDHPVPSLRHDAHGPRRAPPDASFDAASGDRW